MLETKFIESIAAEISVKTEQVQSVVELLDAGGTIPFIARYRKDATGNANEIQIEAIGQRNLYFTALSQRREAILGNIEKQGKLTDELKAAIDQCTDKTRLEDLYLPYKKKRNTKATTARGHGLTSLAEFILKQEESDQSVEDFAQTFLNAEKGVNTVEDALLGAGHIMAEDISSDADARLSLRQRFLDEGKVRSTSTKNSDGKKTKFESYYDFAEALKKIPSHRLLAVLRGVKEGQLRMELQVDNEAIEAELIERFLKKPGSVFEPYVRQAVQDGYRRLMRPSIENEVLAIARQRADDDAIRVFRENARSLFLSPPAGRLAIMGVDPGLRTGCKAAIIDETGELKDHLTFFPESAQDSEEKLIELLKKHNVSIVAVGNGTGSREAVRFTSGVLKKLDNPNAFCVVVNEAGASVYSASKIAREEFADLDITVRGAISIARRLQDPLSELVKLEPRSVGVGQYQHDVNQKLLREGLHRTVVSCVNAVGVDLNTSSIPLLRYVAGIQYGTAQNIVKFRTENGPFKSRADLLKVDGIGQKIFEQCAGFMRILGADNVLDTTAIHPEAYETVEKMAASVEATPGDILRNRDLLEKIDLEQFASGTIGALSLADVRKELRKPARDPRKAFRAPRFLEGVDDLKDLEEGMELEGVVTNVTDFGAFVDIGVHQDGLVHLSQMANRYVRDPREVVTVGEIIKIKVIGVDKELPRISLSIKALAPAPKKRPRARAKEDQDAKRERPSRGAKPAADGDRKTERPRSPRPDRKDRDRKDRQRTGPKKSNGRPAKRRGPAKKPVTTTTSGDTSSPLNTQLADQLEALRTKLGSG